ncbi:lipase family alpha/beta hydrolase [Streptomyces sp. NPDC059002]|uniref:lipase family alpha/beta hydrolase n=1 Tax=Streptomyces sp. NPDC059002 TaxID=3346690 RepID=UPI003675A945
MPVTGVQPFLHPFRQFSTLLPKLPTAQALRALQALQALPPLAPLASLLPHPRALPLPRLRLPSKVAGISVTFLKATALELAILTGHLLLYPSGVTQERRVAPVQPPPDAPRLPPDSRPPALLLHGFIDNRSVFVLLRRALAQHGGRHVESLNYSPLICDIRTAAELLGRHIEEICERTGHTRVDIVGHSLGGLIARYYAQRLGGDVRVRTLVTLGTPHGGTRVAPLADAHPIVRQMRPGSEVIEELKEPAPDCRTHFVNFWSDLDQLMDPLETACIDHPDLTAQNVRVTGIGHLALPVHPAVANGIIQALDLANPGAHAKGAPGGLTVA